ncbi:unnamed protein product [Allacma fusca]|uniref:Uncharacterized protein n=1 Tax=Allacma fusca TaxID=39272 RepID=A0A8J2P4C5_9HEXA|nr:unnamed protein product [Allacma fusca]
MSNKCSSEEKWEVLQELQEAKSNYKNLGTVSSLQLRIAYQITVGTITLKVFFEEVLPDENRDVYGDEDTSPINDPAKNLRFILDNEITADEVKHAKKCLPKRKGIGTDGIPNEGYVHLDPTTL